MTEVLTITIERGDNDMATSFLVWGAFRRYPQNDGDGVFIGEIDILPNETEVSYDWTSPNGSVNWKFIAAPVFQETVGVFSELEST